MEHNYVIAQYEWFLVHISSFAFLSPFAVCYTEGGVWHKQIIHDTYMFFTTEWEVFAEESRLRCITSRIIPVITVEILPSSINRGFNPTRWKEGV